jgi:hypothetical protein
VSLPAAQQHILDRIEGTLQVSEPHLAGMFTIFARLNAADPVRSEPLARPRPRRRRARWLRAGTTVYAFVLVPVMFAMITIGALLSSRTHAVAACEAGYSSSNGSPWTSRPWCQPAIQKTTASGNRLASCVARIPAIRFVTRTAGEASVPPGPAVAAATSATC